MCFLSDLFRKKNIEVKIAFHYIVGGNHYALESDSEINFLLNMPKYTLTQLSIACFQISNRSATSTQAVLFRKASISFFNCTNEFSFLFPFLMIKKCCLLKSSVIFIYHNNQMLATLLHYFLLRHFNRSGFLGALSINVASPATLSGNGDVNGTVGNVTMIQRWRLQLKTDTYLKIWSRNFGYLQF